MPVAAEVQKVIEIPKGVEVVFDPSKGSISISGPFGKLTKTFNHPKIKLSKVDSHISVTCKKPIRKDNALLGTWAAHIDNMIHGVTKGWEYKMKIVYSHFPIKTHVKDNDLVIENFLGEKLPRHAKLVGDTKVKISGDQIILTGIDLELTGQSMANIERATKIKDYDPRVFQDGIYLEGHPKKKI